MDDSAFEYQSRASDQRATISVPALLFSSGLGIITVAILTKPLGFWDQPFNAVLPTWLACLIGLFVAGIGGCLAYRLPPDERLKQSLVSPFGAGWALIFLFLSDWLTRSYNLFQGPGVRGEIIIAALLLAGLFTVNLKLALRTVLLIAIALLAYSFTVSSAGRILYSDDAPTFLYRLNLLKENFPFIPFYNPLWNGGIDARDFFATGALNVFFLFYPLIASIDLLQHFNLIVLAIVLLLVPASTYLATRLAGYHSPTPEIAAILAISTSTVWYRWAIKYGTFGFCTSTALVLVNLVLVGRLCSRNGNFRMVHGILFVFSSTLMLMWTPTGLVFLPAIVFALINSKRLVGSRVALITGALILTLNLPWMALFWQVSSVTSFINTETTKATNQQYDRDPNPVTDSEPIKLGDSTLIPSGEFKRINGEQFKRHGTTPSITTMLKEIRDKATSTNPLILIFGALGLALLGPSLRNLFAATSLWLLMLGAYLAVAKPQLELDRMLVILAFVLTLPAAVLITELFRAALSYFKYPSALGIKVLVLPPTLITMGFLGAAPLAVSAVLSNRSLEQFTFANDEVIELPKAISTYSQGGRVLFSGFVLHELNGGHIAPLVFFSQVPLIASSPFHNAWRYKQVFPKEFMERGEAGIQEYMDVYNVGAVIAHEKRWRDYFRSRPNLYTEQWGGQVFTLFTRNNFKPNYFYQGSGRISRITSSQVIFQSDSPEAVIKFNYLPIVTVSEAASGKPACRVSPHYVSSSVVLIELAECPTNTELSLKSVGPVDRFNLERSLRK